MVGRQGAMRGIPASIIGQYITVDTDLFSSMVGSKLYLIYATKEDFSDCSLAR